MALLISAIFLCSKVFLHFLQDLFLAHLLRNAQRNVHVFKLWSIKKITFELFLNGTGSREEKRFGICQFVENVLEKFMSVRDFGVISGMFIGVALLDHRCDGIYKMEVGNFTPVMIFCYKRLSLVEPHAR